MLRRNIIHIFILCVALFFTILGFYEYETKDPDTLQKYLDSDIVTLSPSGSFFSHSITIKLKTNHFLSFSSDKIFYTLNGDIPTENSSLFTKPIEIPITDELQVVTIRASLLHRGKMSTPISHTYFIDKNINDRFSTKIVSIITDNKNLYDYESGILVTGKIYNDWLKEGGDINAPIWTAPTNYTQRTPEWIKNAYIEIIDSDGSPIADSDVGMSVCGHATSSYSIKSLDLKLDKIYGSKEQTITNFINEDVHLTTGQYPFMLGEKTNSIRLRNSGNDFYSTLIRQNFINELALQSGLNPISAITPVTVFLNGQYYSILEAQDNFSPGNLARALSLPKENLNIINGTEFSCFTEAGVYDIAMSNMNDIENRNMLESKVNMNDLFLYYAIEMILGNCDWPDNNYKIFQYTGDYMDGNPYGDKKYHFILYDTDFAFRLYSDKEDIWDTMFNPDNKSDSKFIIPNLVSCPEYSNQFVNQVCDLLNTTFHSDNMLKVIDKYSQKIQYEIPYLKNTDNPDLQEMAEKFNDHIDSLKFDADERVKYVIPNYLYTYFNTSNPYTLKLNIPDSVNVKCNTLVFSEPCTYCGTYYSNYPIRLTATAKPGNQFLYWEINNQIFKKDTITITPDMISDDNLNVTLYVESCDGSYPIISNYSSNGYNDYFELINPFTNTIHLKDVYLSDTSENLYRYQCPDITLEPNELLKIYCKDNPVLTNFYTNFNLKSMETLYVTKKNGTIVDYKFILNNK